MKKNNGFKGLITVFLVIIGICGIGWFTWHLGGMFIGLVTANTLKSPAKVQAADSRILDLPDINLWTCQVGVFQDLKNAENQVEFLRQKGWKAAIISEDPYTVAIGAFAVKEDALKFCDILSGEDINTWVREERFPALHYKVKGKNAEEVSRVLTISNSLLRDIGNSVPSELAAAVEKILAIEYPVDFARLKDALAELLVTPGAKDKQKNIYNQNLLCLYAEYKQIITESFSNIK
ncbi:MAG: SPOR domain-containing protein [Peptococcaceae bacterium]|nr:SPOR domain-containing protein [Peptococcaceae bacterium]